MVHLPDSPLDSLYCQEQKEVKEWGRDWVIFEASIFTELAGSHNICLYIKNDVLEGSRNKAKKTQKKRFRDTKG